MASIFQTAYPQYQNIGNFTGVSAGIKSAGRVNTTIHNESISSLHQISSLGLAQFGFIQLPREVLFLHDEKGVRVKATREADQVQAPSKTELDADRGLDRIREANQAVAERKTERTQQTLANRAYEVHEQREEKTERAQAPNKFVIQAEEARKVQIQQQETEARHVEQQIEQKDARTRDIFAGIAEKHVEFREIAKEKVEADFQTAKERNKPVLETTAQKIERENQAVKEADAAAERRKPPPVNFIEEAAKDEVQDAAAFSRLERKRELLNSGDFARRIADNGAALSERIAEDRRHEPPETESSARRIVQQTAEQRADIIREAPRKQALEESRKAPQTYGGGDGPFKGGKVDVKA